jgi:hypothetical protein
MPHQATSNADLIDALASPSQTVRENAARELFRRGKALADPVVSTWRRDREIAAVICNKATVGIAVTPKHFAAIRAAVGNPRLSEVPPDQDAEEFESNLGGDAHLDILTTREPKGMGAIARFLAKFGEGIQQVEYVVTDVNRATELLQSRFGVLPIYAQTRTGADGTRVNFFLAGTPDGRKVLIELVETPPKSVE